MILLATLLPYYLICVKYTFAFVTLPERTHNRKIKIGTELYSSIPVSSSSVISEKKKVVVIGGGWAGYSCTESISTNDEEDLDIILLDASASAKGGLAGGYRNESTNNRPVEAGIHGFWREYKNTFDIMEQIEGVDIDDVLGDYTPSVLFSESGKVAVAPVLGSDGDSGKEKQEKKGSFTMSKNIDTIRKSIASNLPPPLDVALLADFDENSKLTPMDRISAIGLLGAWADFEQESPESWARYDKTPATTLFEKAGVSDNLYKELVAPLLHVLPMAPAYDLSAASVLSVFHVFALQSRGAFDVRWCKGSISEKIFTPWQNQLEQRGVKIQGGALVTSISEKDPNTGKFTLGLLNQDDIECDAVVLAVGGTSMGKIAPSSPALSSLEVSQNFDKLRGITCVAVRLFLKPHPTVTNDLKGGLYSQTQLPPEIAEAMKDSPVAVCGPNIGKLDELKETGFCIYDLQRMHDEFRVDETREENKQVAVLEVDFYRADDIANMSDDDIAEFALKTVSKTFGIVDETITNSLVIVDKAVVRAKNAVSHFCLNSSKNAPSNVKLSDGLYICGDWINRDGHASWSTEKAVVTGRQAAESLSKDLGLTKSSFNVIPAAKDTRELSQLRKSARLLRSVVPPKDVPPSPWVFAKQVLSGNIEI